MYLPCQTDLLHLVGLIVPELINAYRFRIGSEPGVFDKFGKGILVLVHIDLNIIIIIFVINDINS